MYAFKKSGVIGDYDVIDEFDVIEYVESLPAVHEPIHDLDAFKRYSAQYFTPSNLKQGLTRSKENISDVQGIIFDLDIVDDWEELKKDFYDTLIKFNLEMYLWQTPSAIAHGSHTNGSRLYIPLAEPILPEVLPKAVDELVIAFAKAGVRLLTYGPDLNASRTVGRLMGLPLQKQNTIVPWDLSSTFRYKVKAKVEHSNFKPVSMHDGFVEMNPSTPENLTSFIKGYVEKHHISFAVGQRDNSLVQVMGGIKKAFNSVDVDNLIPAFYDAGIAQTLDHPEKDITKKAKRLLKGG
ncbi:hypothetical protein [Pediococcus pentosaceus]|uniref:hypothetical protein n=1 Tax=Pediococcus pentosaceus TaxID=1255 RepID=UPI003981F154